MLNVTFDTRILMHNYLDTFDPRVHFKNYHYFEQYDKTKSYNTDPFQMDYGHGLKTYRFLLYDLLNPDLVWICCNPDPNNNLFVVANEILSEQERKQLEPYCTCPYHENDTFYYNYNLVCRCWYKCLTICECGSHIFNGLPIHNQKIIDEARNKINNRFNIF